MSHSSGESQPNQDAVSLIDDANRNKGTERTSSLDAGEMAPYRSSFEGAAGSGVIYRKEGQMQEGDGSQASSEDLQKRIRSHFESIIKDKIQLDKFVADFDLGNLGLKSFNDILYEYPKGKFIPKLHAFLDDAQIRPLVQEVRVSGSHPFRQEIKEKFAQAAASETVFQKFYNQFVAQLDKYNIELLTSQGFNNTEEYELFTQPSSGEKQSLLSASFDSTVGNTFKKYNTDFNSFKEAMFKVLCYLVKRQQSLSKFSEIINNRSKANNINDVNLKLLIHSLYLNSLTFVRQKLILSLSTFNPVPFVIPVPNKINNKIDYQFVSEIFWLLDNAKHYIISFGLGDCRGKSSFLNHIFKTSFEISQRSPFFINSIDLQTDKDFKSNKRNIYVCDAHGDVNIELAKNCSSLFENFIIQITHQFLTDNPQKVNSFIKDIVENSKSQAPNVFIFIRDVDHLPINLNRAKETLQQHIQQKSARLHLYSLPNLSSDEIKFWSEEIRNQLTAIIYSDLPARFNRQSLFFELISEPERILILKAKTITSELLQEYSKYVSTDEHTAYNLFKLYPLFHRLRQYDMEWAEDSFVNNPYERHLKHDTFHLEIELIKQASQERSQLMKRFEDLVLNENNIYYVNLLVDVLKNKVEAMTTALIQERQDAIQTRLSSVYCTEDERRERRESEDLLISKIESKNLSVEFFWRELALYLEYGPDDANNESIKAYRSFILNGYPFEIIDGDNYSCPYRLLKETFSCIEEGSRVLVISVLGPQNSGKSSLMNYLFGCSFIAKAERCTKGVYGTLLKSNAQDYDYILILDSEGLQSSEKADYEHDRKITLFCLAVSQIVLFNVNDQFNEGMKNILQICAASLRHIQQANIPYPKIFFVLNQKADPNMSNHEILHSIIKKALEHAHMHELFEIDKSQFETLSSAFIPDSQVLNEGAYNWDFHKTSSEFLSRIIAFRKKILEAAKNHTALAQKRSLPFSKIKNWMNFAHIMFATINKYPHLAHFKDMQEQQGYHDIAEYLAKIASKRLSMEIFNEVCKIAESSDLKHEIVIQNWFNGQRKAILEDFQKNFDNRCYSHKTRQMGENNITILLSYTQKFWETQIELNLSKSSLNTLAKSADHQVRDAIKSIIMNHQILDERQASDLFTTLYDTMINDIMKELQPSKYKPKIFRYVHQMMSLHCLSLPNLDVLQKEIEQSEVDLIRYYTNSNKFLTKVLSNKENKKFTLLGRIVEFKFLNEDIIYNEFMQLNNNMNNIISLWKFKKPEYNDSIIDVLHSKTNIDIMNYDYIPFEIMSQSMPKVKSATKSNSAAKKQNRSFSEEVSVTRSDAYMLSLISPYNVSIKSIASEETVSSLFDIPKNHESNSKYTSDFTTPFVEYVQRNLLDRRESASKYIDHEKIYQLIYDDTMKVLRNDDNNGYRPLSQEIVVNLIGTIKDQIIRPLDEELRVFGLELSEQTKSSFYVLTIKLLFDTQCLRHVEPIQKEIQRFEDRREDTQNYFIGQTVRNAQMDESVANKISRDAEMFLNIKALEYGQSEFQKNSDKIKNKMSRHQLQLILDAQLDSSKDVDWLYNYVVNPIGMIVGLFETFWKQLEEDTLKQAQQIYFKQLLAVQIVKSNLHALKANFDQIDDEFSGDVLDLFIVDKIEAEQNVIIKGEAAMRLIFSILNSESFTSTSIEGVTLTLKYKKIIPSNIVPFKTEDIDPEIITNLKTLFYNCSISNIIFFVDALYRKLIILEEKISMKTFKIVELDNNNVYRTFKERAVGCTEKCPCCGRRCDVDHFAISSCLKGSGVNKHDCSLGHQLRAMNGYKESYTNEASLKFCEEMREYDRIIYNGQNLTWVQFKELHDSWNFNTTISIQDIQILRDKLFFVWRRIGSRLCSGKFSQSGMIYVQRNSIKHENLRTHFIIAVDDSYSMKGKPWQDLKQCVSRFLEIRENNVDLSVVSCIVFNTYAKTIFKGQHPSPSLCEHLEFSGGETDYGNALTKIMEVVEEFKEDKKFVVVFMSDGYPNKYPQEKLEIFRQRYGDRIDHFWTVGFARGEVGKKGIEALTEMAESMCDTGTYKHSTDRFELLNVFVEIANSRLNSGFN